MKTTKWILITLTVSLFFMGSASSSNATVLRAFVSSTGNDGNIGANCVQASPCKTFNVAIGAVTAGGELIALDTAGYGPITNINKAITIAAIPGQTAFVVAAAGTVAFTVNPGANVPVVLRNISFNGSGAAGTTGVLQQSGNLTIQDCNFVQLSIGLKVTTGAANLEGGVFMNNTAGLRAEGQGPDLSPMIGLDPARVSVVRLSGTFMSFNTTAFEMHNAGANAGGNPGTDDTRGGTCNSKNIFIRSENGLKFTILVGNTTLLTVTGNSEQNTGCGVQNYTVGTYTTPTSSQPTAANK